MLKAKVFLGGLARFERIWFIAFTAIILVATVYTSAMTVANDTKAFYSIGSWRR